MLIVNYKLSCPLHLITKKNVVGNEIHGLPLNSRENKSKLATDKTTV